MSFLTTIPGANDRPSQSQAQIQGNFSSLNTQFSEDHQALTAGTNNGKHKKVTFYQVAAPGAVTDPEAVLYTKTGTGGVYTNYSLPFFRNQSGELPVLPDLSGAVNAFEYQIGNMYFKIGSNVILSANTSTTITWTTPFPNGLITILATKYYQGVVTALSQYLTAEDSGLTAAIFRKQTTGSGDLNFFYMAIGY